MTGITVLFTCHNRKEKTKHCIESIYDDGYRIRYIVTDDGSTDGTKEMLESLQSRYDITILFGDGGLYWCGGMRKAMEYALSQEEKTEYYVLVNDDVNFVKGALEHAVNKSRKLEDSVIVGATHNGEEVLTYGAIRYRSHTVHYDTVTVTDQDKCDTFNCNFVLVPKNIFKEAGIFDIHYCHVLADFDYGFRIRRLGYDIYGTDKYIGVCKRNSDKGTWKDTALSRKERIRKKESPKGLPRREWYYYLRKNFGLKKAIWHSITPYLKIFLGR